MKSIGRRFDRASSSVFSVISPTGGIRRAERRRAPRGLSLGEREEISRGLSTRCSLRSIARTLGRSPSTISREVLRTAGRTAIGRPALTRRPGIGPNGPSDASWLLSVPGPDSISQTAAEVVAGADCRLACCVCCCHRLNPQPVAVVDGGTRRHASRENTATVYGPMPTLPEHGKRGRHGWAKLHHNWRLLLRLERGIPGPREGSNRMPLAPLRSASRMTKHAVRGGTLRRQRNARTRYAFIASIEL